MIHHLRQRVLRRLLHAPYCLPPTHASPVSSAFRLLASAASTDFPKPFAVNDYLVHSCGLTKAQALKASKKLSHLSSSVKPDAVVAFLAGLGLPRSDVATVIAYDPRILCASVEETLAPRAEDLCGLGLSRPEVARIIPFARHSFRRCSVEFWLAIFGSFSKLLQALRMNNNILSADIEDVVKPNLALLQQCGLSACAVAEMKNMYSRRLLTLDPKSLQEAVKRAEELGVERSSRMFRRVLVTVAFMSKEHIARKLGLLQEIGFSQDNVLEIVRKAPLVLSLSEEKIRLAMHFLTKEVCLDVPYIARRPALLMYSLERRLKPRHCLLKVLKEKGLLYVEPDYYSIASMAEKIFVQKFVLPYMDHIQGLADDYASKCSRKSPLDLPSKNSRLDDAKARFGKV